MNHKTKSVLMALAVVVGLLIQYGILATAYDAGIESEKAKCGETIHCAPIQNVGSVEAARYRQFKNCVGIVKRWK